ncbi:hypothetical protein [Hahella sp. HN01]|uniref:hypothetical protein n=1 Tax=Hahella sp. HN01 TaxID=2847262 RepID=UPI001C1ED1E1|nr:hypothetical protein [Hahella sp. HN01]MBU6952281.1 hypothetical protein [Hahella sp. HN01]
MEQLELNRLFDVIGALKAGESNDPESLAIKRKSRKLSFFFWGTGVIPYLLAVALAIFGSFFGLSETLGGVGLALIAVSILTLIAHPFIEIYIHRKVALKALSNPYNVLAMNAKNTALVDRSVVEQLSGFPVEMLKYALLHIRFEKEAAIGRVGLVSGKVESTGIFVAIFLLFTAKSKLGAEHEWIEMLVYGALGLVFLAVYIKFATNRLARAESLLEYVIEAKENERKDW